MYHIYLARGIVYPVLPGEKCFHGVTEILIDKFVSLRQGFEGINQGIGRWRGFGYVNLIILLE